MRTHDIGVQPRDNDAHYTGHTQTRYNNPFTGTPQDGGGTAPAIFLGNTTPLARQAQQPSDQLPEEIHQTAQTWETADLEIFNLLQQHIRGNRARTKEFIRLNHTFGLQQRSSEFEDLRTLLARVSPDLLRFLPRFYSNRSSMDLHTTPAKPQGDPTVTQTATPHAGKAKPAFQRTRTQHRTSQPLTPLLYQSTFD